MLVAISGSHGLIGTSLVQRLESRGDRILRLERSVSPESNSIYWNSVEGEVDTERLESLDAIVHLAGENVGEKRWTATVKKRLWESRVNGTELLAKSLSRLKSPPKVLISASAVGYYGNTGDKSLTEEDTAGDSFLSRLCAEWEAKSRIAASSGVRVVNPRFGVVLAPNGGALSRLLPIFKLGLGGKIGNGKAWMSWISLPDVVSALIQCIDCKELQGPVNLTTPFPITNSDFTRTLGRTLHRPTVCRVPVMGIRLLFGEMGQELLLTSTKALPTRLESIGFKFETPRMEEALEFLASQTQRAC